jgi:oligopeptide/dipeptide ABC transporter ATP-binding protein
MSGEWTARELRVSGKGDGMLLKVEHLTTRFATPGGDLVANDDVSIALDRGEALGIVGESGSGKSVLARAIMGLLPSNASRDGVVELAGRDVLAAGPRELRRMWGREMAMIFQNPMTSLNPVVRVGRQIAEAIPDRGAMRKDDVRRRVIQLLEAVHIPDAARRINRYPHELSGGMCQRVMIACGLAGNPGLLLADEPTTALDVTVQAQVLNLLGDLQEERHMAMILITHDLGVVAQHTGSIAVMYGGQVVEHAATGELFRHTRMPYTRALLDAIPSTGRPRSEPLRAIPGRPVNLVTPPAGCRFAPRCAFARERCHVERPPLEADERDPGHRFRCWYPLGTPRAELDLEQRVAVTTAAAGDFGEAGLVSAATGTD